MVLVEMDPTNTTIHIVGVVPKEYAGGERGKKIFAGREEGWDWLGKRRGEGLGREEGWRGGKRRGRGEGLEFIFF
jgi:hypothetical protein